MQSALSVSKSWYDPRAGLKRIILLILAVLFVESFAFLLQGEDLPFSPIYLLAAIRALDILILWIWGSWSFKGIDLSKAVRDACAITLFFSGAGFLFLIMWKNTFGSSLLKLNSGIYDQSGAIIISFFMTSCLLSPVAEELFFRGLLYRNLREKWNPLLSIGFVSILFASIHFFTTKQVSGAFLPFLGSLIFCSGYEKTKFILTPILLHISGNLIIYMSPFLPFI